MTGWSHCCSLAFLQLRPISVQSSLPPIRMTLLHSSHLSPMLILCWGKPFGSVAFPGDFYQHLVSGWRILQVLIFLTIGDSTGFSYLRLHALLEPLRNGTCTSQCLQPPQ